MKRQILVLFGISLVLIITLVISVSRKNAASKPIPSSNTYFSKATIEPDAVLSSAAEVKWTLLLTGDVIPARSVNWQMTQKQDFMWPLKGIKSVLADADIALANLEAPLLDKCLSTREGMTFCGDARFVQSLAESGVDIVNLANNHTLNFGWAGLAETEEHLQGVGIVTTGFTANSATRVLPRPFPQENPQGEPLLGDLPDRVTRSDEPQDACERNIYCSKLTIKSIQNIKIGFLGYNGVGQRIDRELAQKQISEADKQVDVLVVSVHWGKEYVRAPQADTSIAPDDPKEVGPLFVDWGADVVVGNHPHWYQAMTWYKQKPIFYALGNTVFDQEWSSETKRGYLAKLKFQGTQLRVDGSIDIIPIGLRDYGEAYLLEGEEKSDIIRFVFF